MDSRVDSGRAYSSGLVVRTIRDICSDSSCVVSIKC